MLFVHAYQALLFNRWLGARRDAGYSADAPIEGDRLLRVGADGTTAAGRPIVVSTDNLTEVRELVARGRALIAGPLVGFETSVDIGPAGELLRAVLEPEHLRPADLKLPHSPEIASAGGWRPAVVATPPIRLVPVADGEPSPGEGPSAPAIWTEFTLPKGSYATVLIREFLKTGASR